MNRDEFKAGWNRLADALHKSKDPIEDSRRREYALSLKHVPPDAWAAAVERSVRELKFFPTVAELLKFARDHLELTGAVYTNDRAWTEALRACSRFVPGLRENIDYPNAAIRETVRRIGGPASIALCAPKMLDHRREEFIRFYENLCMSAEAIGGNVRPLTERRYVLQYTAYRTVGGKSEPYGKPFVLDRQTGKAVPPHFLELEGEEGGRELAEFRRRSADTLPDVRERLTIATGGHGGDRLIGPGSGPLGEPDDWEDHG